MDGLMPMPPMTRSVLSKPSTSCRLSFSGLPLIETAEVWRRSSGRLPLIVAFAAPSLAPGVNCTILMMLRPTIGAFWTVSAVSLEDTRDVSVCSSGVSPATVTLSLTAPNSSLTSTRALSPVPSVTRAVWVLKPVSSVFISYTPIGNSVNA